MSITENTANNKIKTVTHLYGNANLGIFKHKHHPRKIGYPKNMQKLFVPCLIGWFTILIKNVSFKNHEY